MPGYTKVTIILKDATNHVDYNKRIIDYLNDRHSVINDNMFTIAIEVADNTNINTFALQGMNSIPAMKIDQDGEFIYGVNSILSALAKLEISNFTQPGKQTANQHAVDQYTEPKESPNSFYDMVMEEMKNNEQEDPDAPSTLKSYHQDLPEAPLTEKMIEEKTKVYDKINEERRKRNPARQIKHSKQPPVTNTKVNVEKMIQAGGYDKGEEMLMRQIVQNL